MRHDVENPTPPPLKQGSRRVSPCHRGIAMTHSLMIAFTGYIHPTTFPPVNRIRLVGKGLPCK